tara:strand:+ start:172 stop:900 length:729 start_codon:yes stop_codon:yes gene_type:complete
MKVALILMGRLDSFVQDFDSLKEFVLDDLSPDIFFAGHPNKMGLEYCDQKVRELWNPKKYILREYTDEVRKEVHPNDEKFNSYKRPESRPHTWLAGMNNLKLANNLKKEYEEENNFTYDICIKARCDCIWHSPITEDQIEKAKAEDTILIPTAWDFKGVSTFGTSDTSAVCNSETMDKYASFIDCVDYYFDDGNIFHPESYMGIHIDTMGLERIPVNSGIDPFTKEPNRSGWFVMDPDRFSW